MPVIVGTIFIIIDTYLAKSFQSPTVKIISHPGGNKIHNSKILGENVL
jgi:hypothetical protein